MKKLLALLLALTMVFAFAACSDSTDKDDKTEDKGNNDNNNDNNNNNDVDGGYEKLTENDISGEWEMVIKLSDILEMMSENADAFENNEALSMFTDMGNFDTDAKMIVDISFEEDGEAIIVMDVNNIMDFYSEIMEDLFAYLEDGGLEKMAEAAGQDMDELLEQLEEQGMTMDDYLEYMRQMMELNMDSLEETMEDTLEDVVGEWEFDNDTIKFIGDDEDDSVNFKVSGYDGNTIYCTISAESDDVEIKLEVTLERK